jgi:hypothetical protein
LAGRGSAKPLTNGGRNVRGALSSAQMPGGAQCRRHRRSAVRPSIALAPACSNQVAPSTPAKPRYPDLGEKLVSHQSGMPPVPVGKGMHEHKLMVKANCGFINGKRVFFQPVRGISEQLTQPTGGPDASHSQCSCPMYGRSPPISRCRRASGDAGHGRTPRSKPAAAHPVTLGPESMYALVVRLNAFC